MCACVLNVFVHMYNIILSGPLCEKGAFHAKVDFAISTPKVGVVCFDHF